MTMHSELTEDSDAEKSPAQPGDPVQRWVVLGIISAEQAAAIRADQAGSAAVRATADGTTPDGTTPDGTTEEGTTEEGTTEEGTTEEGTTEEGTTEEGTTEEGTTEEGTTAPEVATGLRQTGVPPSSGQGLSPVPLVAEALGYLGGAIILVGLGLATGWFWPDLSGGARLSLAAAATAVLLVAGLAVPVEAGRAQARRLRSVLWLLSVTALAGFLSLFTDEVFSWTDERQAAFTAGGSALLAAVLWWRHHQILQHLTLLACLVVATGASVSLLPGSGTSPAACVWAVGVAWYLLGWGGVLRPRREVELAGAVVVVVGTAFMAGEPWGSPLALVTLAALAVLAVRLRDLSLLVITALATLVDLPPIVNRYFHGLLSASGVLLVVGSLLVAAALVAVRRPGPDRAPPRPRWSGGTPTQGTIAAVVVLSVTLAVVVVGSLV
jgi:hypothetical protein